MDYLTPDAIDSFIVNALKEDIGPGDYSSLASIPETTIIDAAIISKDEGVLAGVQLAGNFFKSLDSEVNLKLTKKDGDSLKVGCLIMTIKGKAHAILSAERVVLNCLQRMSGIATKTRHFVDMLKPYHATLLDTRKTTPTIRMLEKWAVKIGGGQNHRFALYDMIMLKDNHIDSAGGIKNALSSTMSYMKQNSLRLKIEVEARSLTDVKEILSVGGADIIMLDNMDIDAMAEAVRLIKGNSMSEASGGIDETNLTTVAATGVDYISVGALTHSFTSLDLSLVINK